MENEKITMQEVFDLITQLEKKHGPYYTIGYLQGAIAGAIVHNDGLISKGFIGGLKSYLKPQ